MEKNIPKSPHFCLFPLECAARKRKGQTVTSAPLSTQPSNELTSLIVRPPARPECLYFHLTLQTDLFSCVLSFTCCFVLYCFLILAHMYTGKIYPFSMHFGLSFSSTQRFTFNAAIHTFHLLFDKFGIRTAWNVGSNTSLHSLCSILACIVV